MSFDSFVGAPDVGPEVKLHHGQAYGDPLFEGNTTGPGTPTIWRSSCSTRRSEDQEGTPAEGRALDKLAPLPDRSAGALPATAAKVMARWLLRWRQPLLRLRLVAVAGRYTFQLSQKAADGDAGTCNGDSGGRCSSARPRRAGITVDGDPFCEENSINVRVDTQSARDFIRPFLKGRSPPTLRTRRGRRGRRATIDGCCRGARPTGGSRGRSPGPGGRDRRAGK